MQRAVAQLGKAVLRLQQLERLAIGETARLRLVADLYLAFRLHAGNGVVVELAAVVRFRLRAFGAGDGQAEQQCHRLLGLQLLVELRRRAAAVQRVTGATGTGDEVWSQSVAGGSRRRRLDPGLLEEGIADKEARLPLRRHIGGRQRERVAAGFVHGGVAAQLFIAVVIRRQLRQRGKTDQPAEDQAGG
ncbi:hypothetical protein D3C72_1633430 [compost metagenome]